MTPSRRGFLALVKRFPEYVDDVRRLFANNEEFLSLCEDYQVCSEALRYWDQADTKEAPERCQEYASLLAELEEEVRRIIGAERNTIIG